MGLAQVVDLGSAQPFKQYALEYYEKGWFPLPLPAGSKSPPPEGFTGHHKCPELKDIESWLENDTMDRCNIGLRVPDGIIGIDVDAYGDKRGKQNLEELERNLGVLPDSWVLSARSDGISGIRFYSVPLGKMWPGEIARDVQCIQLRHRYALCYPSLHPSLKKMYRWYPPGVKIDGRSFSDVIPPISLWLD